MTVNGAVTATGVLLVLLVATGVIGWNAVEPASPVSRSTSPAGSSCRSSWASARDRHHLPAAVGPHHRPDLRPRPGPGVGAISHLYEVRFDGIVFQAAAATVGGARHHAVPVRHPDRQGHRQDADGHHHGHGGHRHGLSDRHRAEPVRRRRAVPARHRDRRHPHQRRHRGGGVDEPPARLRLRRAGRRRRRPEADGVVRRLRPAAHARLALPRDAPPPRQAPAQLAFRPGPWPWLPCAHG